MSEPRPPEELEPGEAFELWMGALAGDRWLRDELRRLNLVGPDVSTEDVDGLSGVILEEVERLQREAEER